MVPQQRLAAASREVRRPETTNACANHPTKSNPTNEAKMTDTPWAIAQRIDAAFHDRDIEALADFWDDNIDYATPDVQLVGKSARKLAEQALLAAFPDARIVERGYTQNNDFIAIEGTMTGVHLGPLSIGGMVVPPTLRNISSDYAALLWFRDGKIIKQRLYFDRLALAEQLGLAPKSEETN
jgi:ketosteroid isomerase-like protein